MTTPALNHDDNGEVLRRCLEDVEDAASEAISDIRPPKIGPLVRSLYEAMKDGAKARRLRIKAESRLPANEILKLRQEHSSDEEILEALTQESIAVRAYELWQERGCPEGSPEVDWFQAEKELLNN